MPFYRLKDGTRYHIKFTPRAKVPPACAARRDDDTDCGIMSGILCDWKVMPGVTCDLPLCEDHAKEVGPDKHLCPAHQIEWQQWQQLRRARGRPVPE